MNQDWVLTRRAMVIGAGAAAVFGRRAFATEVLTATPPQTAGPFYPERLPPDSDADLVSVAGRGAPASGTVTHVFGRVLDPQGRPVAGARVEIWQCDAFGRYHHPLDGGGADANFQGYGRSESDAAGVYRFRTIRPVAYGSRTPHIHFKVGATGFPALTTQMYIKGEPRNASDFILARIADPRARERVIVGLAAADGIEPRALAGTFDIVLAG